MGFLPSYNSIGIEEGHQQFSESQLGFNFSLNEVKMANARLLWAEYSATEERQVSMRINNERVEMHFKLQGRSGVICEGMDLTMKANEHSLFYQHDLEGHYKLYPGENNRFFEIELPMHVFTSMVTEDSPFLQYFYGQLQPETHAFWPGYCMYITSQMHQIIYDIIHTTYTGQMKRLYLEAKTVELFLLQARSFDAVQSAPASRLQPRDIEPLHAARYYMEQHYGETCSILDLSTMTGLNQKKLKEGFKALFGHTVFGYLSHVRMEKARQLLLDEKMTVGEVAELVGYQHQQHFTAAFKKKYGILPGSLKM